MVAQHAWARITASLRADRIRAALFGNPPAAHALVARHGGTLAGIATYAYHWPAAGLRTSIFMKDLYVAEGHRGAGVGERLLRTLRATVY
jgi:GNAT superfamily N-acetyltransferase